MFPGLAETKIGGKRFDILSLAVTMQVLHKFLCNICIKDRFRKNYVILFPDIAYNNKISVLTIVANCTFLYIIGFLMISGQQVFD